MRFRASTFLAALSTVALLAAAIYFGWRRPVFGAVMGLAVAAGVVGTRETRGRPRVAAAVLCASGVALALVTRGRLLPLAALQALAGLLALVESFASPRT